MLAELQGNGLAHHPAAEPTAASTQIWLCADDYGISPGVDTAIRDLVVRRRINATSVMVVAPAFHRSEAVSLSILNSGERRVAVGLHLTLTAPFRPLTGEFWPRHRGAFLPLAATLCAAALHALPRKAVAAEIAAQFDAFAAAFRQPPDFVDGHQHVHLFPVIRDAVLQTAKEKAPAAWVRQCGRAGHPRSADRKARLLDHLSKRFRRRAAAHGVRTNPAFAGTYDFNEEADFARLFPQFLSDLPSGSVVMCHPGFVDAELTRLDPLTTLREREYAFFVNDSFPGLLASHGIGLA